MAKNKKSQESEENQYYSRIIVYPRRRTSFAILITLAIIFVGAILFRVNWLGVTWASMAVPIACVGLLITLFPQTETWEYKPWQASAQQYERHHKR